MTPQGEIRIWWDTAVAAYRVASPYNEALVDFLGKQIPVSDRSYDKPTKIWTLVERQLAPLEAFIKLMNMRSTVVSRQQAEATQQSQSKAGTASTRNEPIDQVIVRFVKLCPPDAMQKAFRAAAIAMHPDRGGNANKMASLNAAWDRIQKEVYGG